MYIYIVFMFVCIYIYIYMLICHGTNTDTCIFTDIRLSHVWFLLEGASCIMIRMACGDCIACPCTVYRTNPFWLVAYSLRGPHQSMLPARVRTPPCRYVSRE